MSGTSNEKKRIMFHKMDVLSSPTTEQKESPKLKKLFDDEDEDMVDLQLGSASVRTPQQVTQLIDMRSKFAHDSRFRVDESFLEEEDEAGVNGDLGTEKAQNMDILEAVLKKPLMPSAEKPVKEFLIPRYDPLAPDSSKYEIRRKEKHGKGMKQAAETSSVTTNGIDTKDGNKNKNKKLKMEVPEAKQPLVQTSNERFYAVSSSLAQELKHKKTLNSAAFKLGSLFDRDESRDEPVIDGDHLWQPASSSQKEDKVSVKVGNEEDVVAKERDLFRERFFFFKNDPRLDEDPFFDPKVIKRLKNQMRDKLVKGMDVTLTKKNKAAKNKRSGHVYQTFKRKNEDGEEYEEKVLRKKDQFIKKKFKSANNRITNKLSARQERLKREREANKGKDKNKNKTNALPMKAKNKGKAFFANKKAKT